MSVSKQSNILFTKYVSTIIKNIFSTVVRVDRFDDDDTMCMLEINPTSYKKILLKSKLPIVIIDHILLFTSITFCLHLESNWITRSLPCYLTNADIEIEVYRETKQCYELEGRYLYKIKTYNIRYDEILKKKYEKKTEKKSEKKLKKKKVWLKKIADKRTHNKAELLVKNSDSVYYTYHVYDDTEYTKYHYRKMNLMIMEYISSVIFKILDKYMVNT